MGPYYAACCTSVPSPSWAPAASTPSSPPTKQPRAPSRAGSLQPTTEPRHPGSAVESTHRRTGSGSAATADAGAPSGAAAAGSTPPPTAAGVARRSRSAHSATPPARRRPNSSSPTGLSAPQLAARHAGLGNVGPPRLVRSSGRQYATDVRLPGRLPFTQAAAPPFGHFPVRRWTRDSLNGTLAPDRGQYPGGPPPGRADAFPVRAAHRAPARSPRTSRVLVRPDSSPRGVLP